jgi:hypothetical protein
MNLRHANRLIMQTSQSHDPRNATRLDSSDPVRPAQWPGPIRTRPASRLGDLGPLSITHSPPAAGEEATIRAYCPSTPDWWDIANRLSHLPHSLVQPRAAGAPCSLPHFAAARRPRAQVWRAHRAPCHMMMIEKNNEQVAKVLTDWLDQRVR